MPRRSHNGLAWSVPERRFGDALKSCSGLDAAQVPRWRRLTGVAGAGCWHHGGMSHDAFDLSRTFVHLGLEGGPTATPLPDFTFTPECLAAYTGRFARDGTDGRLVCVLEQDRTWDSWERHPAGEEVVYLISGRVDLVQERDGTEHVIELHAGEATVNPPNTWHTARVHEPGWALFITPGAGTEVRPAG